MTRAKAPVPFAQRVAIESRRRAMARAGAGWTLLGPDLRHALIAYHALLILGAQEGERYAAAVEVVDAVIDEQLNVTEAITQARKVARRIVKGMKP